MSPERTDPLVLQYSTMAPDSVESPAMREGRFLVVGLNTRLPRLCLKCGREADGEEVVMNFLLRRVRYAQGELDDCTVRAFYCARHSSTRQRARAAGLVLGGLSVAAGLSLLISENDGLRYVSGGLCFATLVAAISVDTCLLHRLRVSHFGNGRVYLLGAGERFLRALPKAPETVTPSR